MGRALIVSAGESANEYLAGHLAGMGYARPLIVPSAAEARRRLDDGDFELVVVNAPLPDEFGHEFCMDAMDKTDAGVIFLVKAAAAEQMEAKISEYGVMVVPKPFSNALFSQVIHMAAAGNHRLQKLREENRRLEEKIAQVRLVSRAKVFLITQKGMTEAEAHHYIEKQAMDTRQNRGDIAKQILDSLEPDSV
ncbi:MAG: ANTAR domain-containing protein [Faecalibacterium sp.]|jgi:response regulator NasT|nr:ANTAR domain-containing protein [Faecalibacterium sp.]